MAADGSIIIDTKIDTSGFNVFQKNATGLKRVLGKIGTAIGAAFAVGKLTAFAKEATELGSNLQEVQNVVDVTFKTMNKAINQFAENALFTSGLSETMAKKYTGTFGAMATAFGFTESEAFKLSTTLTTLSGDIASFYNITQDEAFTKLKSVFTGETETLKDLGVVMTQTALDAFAMEKGIGSTVAQMTEQQKVALRYQFVLERLSAASGDFARTSGSWANQTRILSVQFEQLKATIGQGLINALTPVIVVINTIITGLQRVADIFQQFTGLLFGSVSGTAAGAVASQMAEVADGYNDAAEGAGNLADSSKKAAKEIKKSLMPFDELNKLTSQTADNAEKAGASGGGFGGIGDFGTITADAEVKDEISPKIESIVNKVKELIAPLQQIDFSPFLNAMGALFESLKNLGSGVLDGLEWAWYNILVPLSEWTIEEAAPSLVELLASSFGMLSELLRATLPGFEKLLEWIKPIFEFLGDVAIASIDSFSHYFSELAKTLAEKAPEMQGIISGIGELIAMVWYTVEPIFSYALQFVVGLFRDITAVITTAVKTLYSIMYGIIEFIIGVFAMDWKRAWNGIVEIFTGIWEGLSDLAQFIWDGIVDIFWSIVDSIGEAVREIGGFFNGLFSGGSATYSVTPSVAAYSTRPEIPALARGAVLPANKPFLAMVGDQRHGTNVEAPLDTIKQAVAEVLAGQGGGETVELLRELIATVQEIEVGDEVIGKAAARYTRKTARARGT